MANLNLDPNVTNGRTADKSAGLALAASGPQCDGTQGTVGTPAISCDLVLKGQVSPPLPDWSILSYTWSIGTPPNNATGTVYPCGTQALPNAPCGPGSLALISTTIAASSLQGVHLTQGVHSVTVTAREVLGASSRTSNPSTVDFTWVTSGPAVTIDRFDPPAAGPASDFLGNANYFPSVNISGTMTDPGALAQIIDGEIWYLPIVNGIPIGEIGAGTPIPDGTGIKVTPGTGVWTAPATDTVPYHVAIPSAEFTALPQGTVRIYVHGKDIAGNWGAWTKRDLVLDKTSPVVLDHTTTPAAAGPAVTQPSPGHYTLTFTAQDPATPPPACTVTGTGTAAKITPRNCGIAEQSTVKAVEWQVSYTLAIDAPGQNDFTYFLPAPTNGPITIPLDVSAGPQPYPANQTKIVYRVMDGAGNWSNWYQSPTF